MTMRKSGNGSILEEDKGKSLSLVMLNEDNETSF